MNADEAKQASVEQLQEEIHRSWYDSGWLDIDHDAKCMACGAPVPPGNHDEDCVIGKAEPALVELLARLDAVMERSGAGWE